MEDGVPERVTLVLDSTVAVRYGAKQAGAKKARTVPDLVDRDSTATGPNQLWVADITYVPTWAGSVFLATVLDVWSPQIVGWAMATHSRTELVLEAVNMALDRRNPRRMIHHSDPPSIRRWPSEPGAD